MLKSRAARAGHCHRRHMRADRCYFILLVTVGLLAGGGPPMRSATAQQTGAPPTAAASGETIPANNEVVPKSGDAIPATDPTGDSARGWDRRETLIASLTIFVLAVFLGFELITKVPPTLHTPLMSGSNAISGITLVGAVLAVGVTSEGWLIPLLGTLAVIMATINAVGGFAVTHRMLAMFRRK